MQDFSRGVATLMRGGEFRTMVVGGASGTLHAFQADKSVSHGLLTPFGMHCKCALLVGCETSYNRTSAWQVSFCVFQRRPRLQTLKANCRHANHSLKYIMTCFAMHAFLLRTLGKASNLCCLAILDNWEWKLVEHSSERMVRSVDTSVLSGSDTTEHAQIRREIADLCSSFLFESVAARLRTGFSQHP